MTDTPAGTDILHCFFLLESCLTVCSFLVLQMIARCLSSRFASRILLPRFSITGIDDLLIPMIPIHASRISPNSTTDVW